MTLELTMPHGDAVSEPGTRDRKPCGTTDRVRLDWPAVVARCLVPLALAAAHIAATAEVTEFLVEVLKPR
jgi:hypothetical protein